MTSFFASFADYKKVDLCHHLAPKELSKKSRRGLLLIGLRKVEPGPVINEWFLVYFTSMAIESTDPNQRGGNSFNCILLVVA